MGVATRRAADTEEMVSDDRKFRTGIRARHRQFGGETVQPDLLDVTVGNGQRGDERESHQRLVRSRSAAASCTTVR